MLLSLDDEQRNVLHIACMAGSTLIEFIVEQAYNMQILQYIINAADELNQTPLYMLCVKGHQKKMVNGVYQAHVYRHQFIKLLVKGQFSDEKKNQEYNIGKNPKNLAKWLVRISQIKYTPLHWLAYWNDYASIDFLLD